MIRLLFHNRNNRVLMVFNQLIKKEHYILYTIDKNNITVKTTI